MLSLSSFGMLGCTVPAECSPGGGMSCVPQEVRHLNFTDEKEMHLKPDNGGGSRQKYATDQYGDEVIATSKREVLTIFPTQAMLPKSIDFVWPEDVMDDDSTVVSGPHGPLRVPVPDDARPGASASFWNGPPRWLSVTVPPGAQVLDTFRVPLPDGSGEVQVDVPCGMGPGERFVVDLDMGVPVVMVRVPEGACVGNWVSFRPPFRKERLARVPDGILPGQYFIEPLDVEIV